MATLNVMAPSPVSKAPVVAVTTTRPPTPASSPPLPAPRTITELISQRARQLPNEPIIAYPSQGVDYVEYTFSQLETFSRNAASKYTTQLPVRSSSSDEAQVVAVLGSSNLDYVITTLALTRLGFTVLFLSTRISEAAYTSLLEATKCQYIITDASFQKTATSLQSIIPKLQILRFLEGSQYDTTVPTTTAHCASSLNLDDETNKICWIIHSSGSTGLPKPIYQTHQAALRNYEQNMNMKGFITLPLFHAHGLSSVFRSITSVKKIYMYNANLPLTTQYLLGIMNKYNFEIFYGVPYALKLLSETPEGIAALSAMKIVMFGGSACPDALGDLLVDGGVNLISHYGTTETGQLMTSFRPAGDKAWNYVREHEKLAPYLRWEDRGANVYELVVLSGWPSKVATNRPDGAYATKDLFEPHPTITGAWKYSGRLDDTIVLVNGEKAIPIAMEQAVRQNRLVREAVVFGTGKSQLGMMIVASDAVSCMSHQDLINAIWPTVTAENKISPAYAQITPDMVRVLPAGTAYPSTDKGTVIRQAFYRAFHSDIEEIYHELESRSAGTLVLSDSELRAFLRTQILQLAHHDDEALLADDTDLFSLGVDSLQSTRLRVKIMQEIQLNGNPLPQNVVFEYPTIARLAEALIKIRDSETIEAEDVTEQMADLVAKYGVFPRHVPMPHTSTQSCVVVTGATGSLGAHLVAQLVLREDITEVCCLVRAGSNISAKRRVVRSMSERSVYNALPLAARRKITCFASDFSEPTLGLDDAVYDNLSKKITSLIHCAWSVNFNKTLSSFETDCVAGARHLMLLCLSAKQPTPASFNFCSSVSTVASTPGELVPETIPESFKCAQGMGYAQSKLVTEHLVTKAANETGMQARVLRVGQIIADTQHGIWNDTEAIPLMLQAAVTISALPALDESPRWLPVDTVATSLMDISLSSTTQQVFNIVNPKTFHWTTDLIPALRSAGLKFEEVSQREWIRRLRASNPDPEVNPTIKLAEFFASKYDNDITKRKSFAYVTTGAESLSSALTAAPRLSQETVSKFVKHFLATSWAPKDLVTKKMRLLVVSDPSGSDTISAASGLAEHLQCGIIEGDAIHDALAVTKMSQGVALSALDRQIWLCRIKIEILERVRAAQLLCLAPTTSNHPQQENIILTCSALGCEHRNALRNIAGDGSIETVFIVLQASEDALMRRVGGSVGHNLKVNMARDQLEVVESQSVEEVDVFPVDAEDGITKEVVDFIAGVLGC